MKIRNRLFAIIMVLTMTFTYLPGMAFATSDDSADLPVEQSDNDSLDPSEDPADLPTEQTENDSSDPSDELSGTSDTEKADSGSVSSEDNNRKNRLMSTSKAGSYSEVEYATESEALDDGFMVEKTKNNDGYILKAYSGTEESVTIPSRIEGIPLIYINSKAFDSNESIINVIIPSTVKEMYGNAFYKCTSLKTVEIYGNAVDKWRTYQWINECGVLDYIYLGKDVTLYYESENRIPVKEYRVDNSNSAYFTKDGAVIRKSNNEIVLYPMYADAENYAADNITSVDDYAFYNNKNLKKLNLAFDGTSKAPCGGSCFSYMEALETLALQGMSCFSSYGLEGSTKLKTVLVTGTGSSWVTLDTSNNISVEEFIIGEGIKSLDCTQARNNYSPNYKKLIIGKDVDPSEVPENYDDPFAGLRDNVSEITVDEDNPFYIMNGGALCSKDGKVLYAYNMHMTQELTYNIPDGIEVIYPSAFRGNPEVYVINIPESVSRIGRAAFCNMENLSYLYIPETVLYIDGAVVDQGVTIYGKPGSVAEEYANKSGLTFINSNKMEETIGTEEYNPSTWSEGETEEITPVINTYIIQNAAQLAWLAEANNSGNIDFTGKIVKLAADIDLDGIEWTPIGTWDNPFRGSFDGQGHTIKGLTLSGKNGGDTGLFGRVANKTSSTEISLKNIVFEGVSVSNCSGVGILSGVAGVTSKGAKLEISNISVKSGKTDQVSGLGGIIGTVQCGLANSSFRIAKCNVKLNINKSSGGSAGGVVCSVTAFDSYSSRKTAKGIIEECSYEGTIKGSGMYHSSAGIVRSIDEGKGEYTIKSCVTRGTIYAGKAAGIGGIITGVGKNVTLDCCLNLATVDGGYDSGGIAASNSGVIKKCENDGYVNLAGMMANNGGIVGGNSGTISDSVNLGEVAARYYSGGIAGNNSGTIERCYNAGDSDGVIGAIHNIGGLSGYQTGAVNYSYADVPASAASLYGKGGFVDTPTSKELTTAQMKSEASYETWDFDNVWEFDSQYCYGYPVITEIKPLLPKHPDRGGDHASENEAQIFAVDQDGNALSDVTVTYGSGSNISSGVTDNEGSVILEHKKGMKGIEADLDGYVAYSDPEFTLPKTHEYTVRLIKVDGMDPFALSSVILNYNTNRYELLSEEKELNKSYDDTRFSIDTKLAIPDNIADHYELIQPKYSDYPIAFSDDGHFSNLKLGDFGLTTHNNAARDIFIRVYDTNNQPHDTKINLRIVKVTSPDLGSIKFNDDLKIHVSDNIPVFGGTDIEMPTAKFPLVVEIAEDKWEVSVNVGELSKKGKDKLKLKLFEIDSESGSDAYEDFLETYAKYSKKEAVNLAKNPSMKLSVIGFASGDMPLSGKSDIDLKLYVGFSVGSSNEWPVHGMVVALDIKGTIYGDGTIKLKHYEQSSVGRPGEDGELYEKWDWEGKKVDLGGKIETGLSLLIGLPYLVSGGIEGKGEMGYVHELFTSLAGPKEWYLTGSAGITGRLNGSEVIYWPLLKPKEKLYLYRRDTNTTRNYLPKLSLKGLLKETSEASPDTINRESYTPTSDGWNGETAGTGLLMDNAYPDMAPQMISANGKTVMLFLDDGDKNRATDDKSMLMYSVYNSGSDTWSSPAPVWDDGTADFAFSTYSDGTNAFVAWNNAKGSLTPGSSLVEKGKNTEIAFAAFDGEGFTDTNNITNNNEYETLPKITYAGKKKYVSWKVNSENDIFGTSGINSVYVASAGSSWTTKKIADVEAFITNDNLGFIDETPYYAYIAQNGDANEYLPHLMSIDGTDITLAEESAINIGFASFEGGRRVFWTDGEGVLHTSAEDGNETSVPGWNSTGLIKQVIESPNGKKAVLFTRNSSNKADAYVVMYDPDKDVWSEEIALTGEAENSYVEMINGQFLNDELVIAYNQRMLDANTEDHDGTNSLRTIKTGTPQSHVIVSDVDYNEFELEAGATLPVNISISNSGTKAVSSANITVSDGDEVLYDKTADIVVAGGGTVKHEIELPIPEGFTKSDLKFDVRDAESGSVFDDSSKTLTMGKAVLSTVLKKYCFNGKYQFVLSIENSGYDTINGVAEFYDIPTGQIIEQYDFRRLGAGEIKEIRTNLDQLEWEDISSLQIGARIKRASNDAVIGDTDRSTIVVQDTPRKVEYVKISTYEATLTENEPQIQLSAEVVPEDAYNKTILWKSEDPSVATVDDNGLVTAVSGGTTKIYAYSEEGNKAVSCKITCDMPKRIKRIYMESDTVEVERLKNTTIGYTYSPADASTDNVTFMIDDPSIAKISKNGKVIGLKPGETTVTVASDGKSDTCKLKVEENSRLTDAVISKDVNDFNSDNVTGYSKNYLYMSDNADTKYIMLTFDEDTYVSWNGGMTISGDDNISASFEGRELGGTTVIVPGFYAFITFYNASDYYNFRITEIKELNDETIEIDGDDLTVDQLDSESLSFPYKLIGTDSTAIDWSSSNSNIATVDNNGRVKGYMPGEAVISASAEGFTVRYNVTVNKSDSVVVAESIDDLHSEGPYDDSNEIGYIYASPDSNAAYLKVTLSEDSNFTEDWTELIIQTSPEGDINDKRIDSEFLDSGERTFVVKGNMLIMDYSYSVFEEGGFKVESIETLDELNARKLNLEETEITMEEGEYKTINVITDPAYCKDFVELSVIDDEDSCDVISVNPPDTVYAQSVGTAYVKAKIGDLEDTCKVTVTEAPPEEFTIVPNDDYTIYGGEVIPPLVVLDDYGYELENGYDYKISINGKTVTVTGLNEYSGVVKYIIVKIHEEQSSGGKGSQADQKARAAEDARQKEIAENHGVIDYRLPKVKIQKPKAAKKSFTAKWKKLKKKQLKAVKGIEIEYSLNKKFTKSVKFKTAGKKKTKIKIKKLKSKKTYYVRMHTYKVVKGVKYVSPWSAVKKVKVK